MILYGKNPLIEVLKARRRKINQVFLLKKKEEAADPQLAGFLQKHSQKYQLVDRSQLDKLAGTQNHQGVAANVGDFPYEEVEVLIDRHPKNALFLMLDSLKDPQNFGTICRSAYCFGVDGIIINKDQSVEVTPAVCKASAGSVEHLSVSKVTNLARTLEFLKKSGFWIYGASASADVSLTEVKRTDKIVIVLGSEGEGIRRLVKGSCDYLFKIPMVRDFDSLNVAQAATVILYEFSSKSIP